MAKKKRIINQFLQTSKLKNMKYDCKNEIEKFLRIIFNFLNPFFASFVKINRLYFTFFICIEKQILEKNMFLLLDLYL